MGEPSLETQNARISPESTRHRPLRPAINAVMEVFRRWPVIRRSRRMLKDSLSTLYPVLSRRATLKKVAATMVAAPSTIRWNAKS